MQRRIPLTGGRPARTPPPPPPLPSRSTSRRGSPGKSRRAKLKATWEGEGLTDTLAPWKAMTLPPQMRELAFFPPRAPVLSLPVKKYRLQRLPKVLRRLFSLLTLPLPLPAVLLLHLHLQGARVLPVGGELPAERLLHPVRLRCPPLPPFLRRSSKDESSSMTEGGPRW